MIRTWIAIFTATIGLALAACSQSPGNSGAANRSEPPATPLEGNSAPEPAAPPNASEPGSVIDENMSDDDRGNDTGRRPAARATQTQP